MLVLATLLPESLHKALREEGPFGQRAQVSGYFLKLIRYQSDRGPLSVPLLVAPAVIVLEQPTMAPALNPGLLRNIRQDKTFPDLRNLTPEKVGSKAPFLEVAAYQQAVALAAQTPLKAFEASAAENRDLTYGHLIRKPVLNCGKVVTVEGTLRRLTKEDAAVDLQDRGVETVYQGWIELGDRDANPVVVVFPELPEGLKPGDKLKVKVRFTGYFFKRYPYKVGREERKTLMLIGPTLTLLSAPPVETEGGSPGMALGGPLLASILGLMVGTLLFIVGLGWWFRRGDRAVRQGLRRYEASKFADEGASLDVLAEPPPTEGIQAGPTPGATNGHTTPPTP